MYEAYNRKKVTPSISLQPLVADQGLMPHIKAMYVPFQIGNCRLTCYKGLQSDRLKCLRVWVESSQTSLCKSVSKTILFGCEKESAPAFLSVILLFLRVQQAIIPHLKEDIQGYLLIGKSGPLSN